MGPSLKIAPTEEYLADAMGVDKERAKEKIAAAFFTTSTHAEALAKLWRMAETPEEAMYTAFTLGRVVEGLKTKFGSEAGGGA